VMLWCRLTNPSLYICRHNFYQVSLTSVLLFREIVFIMKLNHCDIHATEYAIIMCHF
jgi:hypothetical protein